MFPFNVDVSRFKSPANTFPLDIDNVPSNTNIKRSILGLFIVTFNERLKLYLFKVCTQIGFNVFSVFNHGNFPDKIIIKSRLSKPYNMEM